MKSKTVHHWNYIWKEKKTPEKNKKQKNKTKQKQNKKQNKKQSKTKKKDKHLFFRHSMQLSVNITSSFVHRIVVMKKNQIK